jgi:VanZ family protein
MGLHLKTHKPGGSGRYFTIASHVFSWAVLIILAILSLVPGNERPHIFVSGQLEHVVAYALAAVVISIGINRPLHLLAIGFLLPAYAGALEFAQLWVPGRDPKLIDVAAGALGSSLAIASVYVIKKLWAPKQKLIAHVATPTD